MDLFIRYVIKDKFIDIEELINLNKIDKKDYHKLYNYFIYFYMLGKITDKTMYYLTYLLIGKYKKIHIHHINQFHFMLDWHVKNGKCENNTFMIMNIYNNLHITNHRIKGTIHFLKTNSKKLDRLITNHTKTSEIMKLIKHDFIEYIEYFDDKIIQNNMMIGNLNPNLILIHERELNDRLNMIAKYYGLKLLEKIGINLISGSYFKMLSFEEKVEYYKKCVMIITHTGKNIYSLFEIKKKLKKFKRNVRKEYNAYKETLKK